MARRDIAFQESLAAIMRKIPRHLFIKDRRKAYRSIAMTLSLLGLGYGALLLLAHWDHVLAWPLGFVLSWWFLGTVLTGGFDLAHDAAHRALFDNERENNAWGHFFSSLVGWPFDLWRLAHNIHHAQTNNARRDIAWDPYTRARLAKLPAWIRWQYTTIRSQPLLLWVGGFLHLVEQYVMYRKGKRFHLRDHQDIRRSLLITALIFGSFAVISWSLGGYFFLFGFIIPLVRYYWWLAVFTLLHHTHPERPFFTDKEWKNNVGAAQLLGTINVRYGWYVDLLTHHIAWHIPHHVTVAIPHYHLVAATAALKDAYPGLLHEETFSYRYLATVVRHCQQVESLEDLTWLPFDADSPREQAAAVQEEPVPQTAAQPEGSM